MDYSTIDVIQALLFLISLSFPFGLSGLFTVLLICLFNFLNNLIKSHFGIDKEHKSNNED